MRGMWKFEEERKIRTIHNYVETEDQTKFGRIQCGRIQLHQLIREFAENIHISRAARHIVARLSNANLVTGGKRTSSNRTSIQCPAARERILEDSRQANISYTDHYKIPADTGLLEFLDHNFSARHTIRQLRTFKDSRIDKLLELCLQNRSTREALGIQRGSKQSLEP